MKIAKKLDIPANPLPIGCWKSCPNDKPSKYFGKNYLPILKSTPDSFGDSFKKEGI